MRAAAVVAAGAALLVIASATQAGISWSSQGTLTTVAASPSITLGLGKGSEKDRFVDNVTLSTNKTSFGVNLHAKVGANADISDIVRLYNNGTVSRNVTLHGARVTDPNVISFAWLVKDGATTRATLDMLATNPAASFSAELSTTYKFEAKIKIARGASATDATFGVGVWSAIS